MKLKGLYRLTHSGIFYYQPPQVGGIRPKPVNLGTKDEQIAVEKYHRAVADAQRQFAGGSVRMEAARFLAQRRSEGAHTERSSEESEADLERFAVFTGNPPLAAITGDDIEAYRVSLVARGLAAATIRSRLARIKALFSWAVESETIREHPGRGVKLPKAKATRTERYCTREERDRLLATVPEDRPDLACYLWLGFFAGLRKSELIEAHRDWVDLAGGVLHVRQTDTYVPKDKEDRTIRLGGRLKDFLARYLAAVPAGEHPYLIRPDRGPGKKSKARGTKAWRYRFDMERAFKSHVSAQGLPWVSNHTMRHTFATLHVIAGTPLGMVAKELGDDEGLVFRTYVGYSRHSGHESATD